MKNIFKKLFGKKEKPKEEVPLLTKDEEQPISVPSEIKIENVMDIVQPEEPIAPTLERQDDELKSEIDYKEPDEKSFDDKEMKRYLGDEFGQWSEPTPLEKKMTSHFKKLQKKSTKPKKQAKKKDNRKDDDDKRSWPGNSHFNL